MRREPTDRTQVEQAASEALAAELARRAMTHEQLTKRLNSLGYHMDTTSIGRLINGKRGWALSDYFAINTALDLDLLDKAVRHVGPCVPLHEVANRMADLVQQVSTVSREVEAAMASYMPDAPSPAAALNLTEERTGLLGWADGAHS